MLAKTKGCPCNMHYPRALSQCHQHKPKKQYLHTIKYDACTPAMLPSIESAAMHHVLAVPTLCLSAKQSLSDSGIALLLVLLHSRLQDTRVYKIID